MANKLRKSNAIEWATATGTVPLLERSCCHSEDAALEPQASKTSHREQAPILRHLSQLSHLLIIAGLLIVCLAGVTEGRRHAPLMFEESDTGRRSNRPAGKSPPTIPNYHISIVSYVTIIGLPISRWANRNGAGCSNSWDSVYQRRATSYNIPKQEQSFQYFNRLFELFIRFSF